MQCYSHQNNNRIRMIRHLFKFTIGKKKTQSKICKSKTENRRVFDKFSIEAVTGPHFSSSMNDGALTQGAMESAVMSGISSLLPEQESIESCCLQPITYRHSMAMELFGNSGFFGCSFRCSFYRCYYCSRCGCLSLSQSV